MGNVNTVPAGHPERPEGDDGRRLLARMNAGHHEDLALWGLSHLELAPTDRVLDIGCGGGANLCRLLDRLPDGRVCGIDHSPLSVKMSRKLNHAAIDAGRCAVYEGDSESLPFADGLFQAVTAFETVYYWDIEAAFAEVYRVLTAGGRFLICNEDDGSDPDMAQLAKGIPGMIRYTAGELEACLMASGFYEVAIDTNAPGDLTVVATKRA